MRADGCDRICVLTTIRVKAVWDFDFNDATFNVVPVAIWSVLEPTLGVVNACLPVMRPALQKLFGLQSKIWTLLSNARTESKSLKSSKLLSRSIKEETALNRSYGNDSQKFERGQYALREQKHVTQVDGAENAFRESETQQRNQANQIPNVIEVTNTWDVQSTEIGIRDIV